MLYDQAQLLSVFSKASVALDSLHYKAVADEILQYCVRELYSPDKGAFMAAQDADSAPLAGDPCKKGKSALSTLQKEHLRCGPERSSVRI